MLYPTVRESCSTPGSNTKEKTSYTLPTASKSRPVYGHTRHTLPHIPSAHTKCTHSCVSHPFSCPIVLMSVMALDKDSMSTRQNIRLGQLGFTETHSLIPVMQQPLPVTWLNSQKYKSSNCTAASACSPVSYSKSNDSPTLSNRKSRSVQQTECMETRMCTSPLGIEYNLEGLRVAVCWCQAHNSLSSSGPYSRTGNNLPCRKRSYSPSYGSRQKIQVIIRDIFECQRKTVA